MVWNVGANIVWIQIRTNDPHFDVLGACHMCHPFPKNNNPFEVIQQ